MDWTNDFLIPVTKLTSMVVIFGFILLVMIRAVYIKWNKRWKWVLKYKSKRPTEEMVDMIRSIKDMTDGEIKKNLFLSDYTAKQVNELLYLKKIIGGKQNDIR